MKIIVALKQVPVRDSALAVDTRRSSCRWRSRTAPSASIASSKKETHIIGGSARRSSRQSGRQAALPTDGHMNGVLAVLEQRAGVWNPPSWGAAAAAQMPARHTGHKLFAAVAGEGVAAAGRAHGESTETIYALKKATSIAQAG